jgi:hypothetical protein
MKQIVGDILFLYRGDALSLKTCGAMDYLEVVQVRAGRSGRFEEDLARIDIPLTVFAKMFGEEAVNRIFYKKPMDEIARELMDEKS